MSDDAVDCADDHGKAEMPLVLKGALVVRKSNEPRRILTGQLIRFLITGGSNTVVTFFLFVALQSILTRRTAYTSVFVLGVTYTVILNSVFVFKNSLKWRPIVTFLGYYLVVYSLGIVFVSLLGSHTNSSWKISFATVVVFAPLNFLVGRRIFRPVNGYVQQPPPNLSSQLSPVRVEVVNEGRTIST